MAYDDGYYYGQCKIVAVVDNTEDNGKTVLITTDDNKTYSGTIANKKCEFLLPPRTLYTVQKVSSGSAEFTIKVEAGYGDYILVHLDTGYVEVKQGDIVGLDYIKAATADNLKNKVPEANAVKELNSSLSNKQNKINKLFMVVMQQFTTESLSFGSSNWKKVNVNIPDGYNSVMVTVAVNNADAIKANVYGYYPGSKEFNVGYSNTYNDNKNSTADIFVYVLCVKTDFWGGYTS